jgi:DNA-binding NarL/FixJ family response regulator
MVITGIEQMISGLSGFEIIGSSFLPIAELDRIASSGPEIVVFDYQLPDITGVEVFAKLKSTIPTLKGICYTQHSEAWIIQQLIKSKVDGIVLKSENPQFLLDAVVSVSKKQSYYSPLVNKLVCHSLANEFSFNLTKREIEVLRLISTGLSSKEIAERINLSVNTVEDYRKNLMAKLEVKNVAELVCKATKMGYT